MYIPENIFLLLCEGTFTQAQVSVSWSENSQAIPTALQKRIDEHWEYTQQNRSSDSLLFDGAVCGLLGYAAHEEQLNLQLEKTWYRHLIFSNAHNQEIKNQWGKEYISTALGVSAVVCTSDGFMVLMWRSELVGEFPGYLDVFGGHIDPDKDTANDRPNPFIGMRAELQAELGIQHSDLHTLLCIGLIRAAYNLKPELVFAAETDLSLSSLLECARTAAESDEYVELLQCEISKSEAENFLCKHQQTLTPSAYGSVWLFNRWCKFG